MKVFYGLFIYMLIGGFLYGIGVNAQAERCNSKVYISDDSFASIVAWPSVFGVAIIASKNMKELEC